MAVAVAGPLLLMLLARPPLAAAGDIRKSGEPARTRGSHAGRRGRVGWGRAGWGAAGSRGLHCDSLRGRLCAHLARAQGPDPHPRRGGGVPRAALCRRPVLK